MQKKTQFSFHFRVPRTRNLFRLARPRTSAKPKLRKKLVKAKRFWKINAIQPKIKARRGRMKKSK